MKSCTAVLMVAMTTTIHYCFALPRTRLEHGSVRAVNERIPSTPVKPKSTPLGPAHVGETVTIETQPGALRLTIDKMEFSAGRVRLTDDDREIPSIDEKLLVIHYTLMNPNPTDVPVNGETVRFTALDEFRKPHVDSTVAATEDGDVLDAPLKAKGTVDAVKVVHVPAHGPMAALLVRPGTAESNPLHVEVTGKIDPLPAPYADPQDASGDTVLATIPAKQGEAYPVGDVDLTLQNVEYSQDPLLGYNGENPPDGDHYYAVFTFDVVSRNPRGTSFSLEGFNPSLSTADGLTLDPANAPLLNGMLNLAFEPDLTYGDDRHFRVYFVISIHDSMESLTIRANEHAHKYVYDLSEVQKPQT